MNLFLLAALFSIVGWANAQGLIGVANPDIIQFYRRNRIPYWAKWQDTPLGPRFFWRRTTEQKDEVKAHHIRVKCSYSNSTLLLDCTAPSTDAVVCKADALLDTYNSTVLNIFAISAAPRVGVLAKPETVRYAVYPQYVVPSSVVDVERQRTWLNSSFVEPLTQKPYVYSIYSGEKSSDFGLRVLDAECYGKLVRLFSNGGFNTTIVAGGQSVDVLGGFMLI
jgi:hypothetical protein